MSEIANVYFINPPDTFLEHAGDRPPLGLAYLSGYLKKFNHKTKIIDMNHDRLDIDEVIKDDPDFVCFTIPTPNYNEAVELANEFKKKGIKIIAGGNHVAGYPNEPKTLAIFDYVVTGTDGEEALKRIVEGQI